MDFFGWAWIGFALALALHVADEAAHDFLSVYNPMARMIRARLWLPIPVFTFRVWLGGLIAGIALLLALSPLAFAGAAWLRTAAIILALAVGIGNGLLHLAGSLKFHRMMPGTISAPLLIAAGGCLIWAAD